MYSPDHLFDLERFVRAQNALDTYSRALQELRSGRKRSHWMWFIFPQPRFLARPSTILANFYGIVNKPMAQIYLGHPILGARLMKAMQVVLDSPVKTAVELLGETDAATLWSCVTMFCHVDHGEEGVVKKVLDKYYDGLYDEETLRVLGIPVIMVRKEKQD